MSRMISYLSLKTPKTHSKHHQNVNHYPRAPNIFTKSHTKHPFFPWIGNKPSALLTTLPATLPNITKRTQIQASYDDFQMTSSGIHMYWCCTAASGLSRFSSLCAHDRIIPECTNKRISQSHLWLYFRRPSPVILLLHLRTSLLDTPTLICDWFWTSSVWPWSLTAAESGCVRSTLPAWIRIRIARAWNCTEILPPFFFLLPFFSSSQIVILTTTINHLQS